MIHFKPNAEPIEFLLLNRPLGKSISFKAGESVKAEVLDILPNGAVVARIKGQKLALKTEIPLEKNSSLLLKVMEAPTDGRLKLKLIDIQSRSSPFAIRQEDIANIAKDPKTALKLFAKEELSLFFLREFGSRFFKEITGQVSKDLTRFAEILSDSRNERVFKNRLESLLPSIDRFGAEELKSAVERSGIFFEQRLKNAYLGKREPPFDDMKALLYEIADSVNDKEIKKEALALLDKIETYQVLSRLNEAIYTFLPLIWDRLKEGEIALKKREGKNHYLCKIALDFEDIGNVAADILMLDFRLNIFFKVENREFEAILKSDIDSLKEDLLSGLIKEVEIGFDRLKSESYRFEEGFKSLVDIKV